MPVDMPPRAPISIVTPIEWVEHRDKKRRLRSQSDEELLRALSSVAAHSHSHQSKQNLTQSLMSALQSRKFPVTFTRLCANVVREEDMPRAPISSALRVAFETAQRKPSFRRAYENLREVCNARDDYDAEFLRPTRHAFDTAVRLLIGAGLRTKGAFPQMSACADGEGGLAFEWHRHDRGLLLLVPPTSETARIFWLNDQSHKVEKSQSSVSPSVLASALRWLID